MPPKALLSLARLFGFGYPKRTIQLVDANNKMITLEDFTVTVTVSEKGKAETKAKAKAQAEAQAEAEKTPDANANANANANKMSIVTDRRTGETYAIQGDAEALFAPKRPAELYREAGISAVLPGFIIYNILLFWAFDTLPPVDPYLMTILGTSFVLMSIFNARYAYMGVINSFAALEKADVGGLKLFIPAMREYLALQPSEDKQLRDAVVSSIVAKIRPLEAANEKLMQELHQVADKVDTAFKLGLRLRNTFMPSLERLPAPALLIGLFALGLVLGWVLSGGVGMGGHIPPDNSTAIINGSVRP